MGLIYQIKNFFIIHPKIQAILIDESGRMKRFKTKYDNNRFIKRGCTYVVKHDRMIYDKNREMMPTSFYYEGNPEPLLFNHERNPFIDGKGFKAIIEDQTIEQLFSTNLNKLLQLVMILVIVGLGMNLFILLILFKVIKV
jgi:hypothetical protein